MPFHFCPQCGDKLQPDFKFCPSCGEKLPCPEAPGLFVSPLPVSKSTSIVTFTTVGHKTSPSVSVFEPKESTVVACSANPVSARPPLRKTRNSLRLDNLSIKDAPLPTPTLTNVTLENEIEADRREEALVSPPSAKSPQKVRGNAKRKAVDEDTELLPLPSSSPASSPSSKSPSKGKSKTKKTKGTPALEPLQDGTEVTDTAGKKWKLVRMLSQAMTEIMYEVVSPNAKEGNYTLKLGAKDGKIFNEQNFLQRAAKPVLIDKWIKQNKMDFIGLPQCVGFGLHADTYRFLIFPNMGQSLQSLMNKHNRPLSEVTVLQLASRLLDILVYLHSNEYVHGDINAENVYIKEGHECQVYLVGYNHAFRFCPGGHHVEYRECSRTPHEGAVETISLDSHNGAAPSRRSDLQSLGYCMLYWHTGTLPWITQNQPLQIAAEKRKYIEDVPGLLRHCFGKKTVSAAFKSFLCVVMALEYNVEPDYAAMKSVLGATLTALGGSVEQPLII